MSDFEITGWKMPTLAEASTKALLLLKQLSASPGGFAVEAHCQDLDALKRVTDAVPSNRCACYCWKAIANGSVLRMESSSALRGAYLVFMGAKVSIYNPPELPPYDWDENPMPYSIVRLDTFHPEPLKSEDAKPSPRTMEILATLTREIVGGELQPVGTCSSWHNSGRGHSYLLKAPRSKSLLLAADICSLFRLNDGIGSFEFLGTPEQLEVIRKSQGFRFENFPSTCWNLCYPADAVFSFGVSAILSPVPNVQPEQLLLAASVIDGLGGRVQYRVIVKNYIAWKLSETTLSPRTHGNYILISQQKSGYAIFVGFERYEDKDPAARKFTSFAAPMLEGMGAQLKRK